MSPALAMRLPRSQPQAAMAQAAEAENAGARPSHRFELLAARPASDPLRRLVSHAELTDSELVSRARNGDASAEEAIYRRHVSALSGLSLCLLRHRADAEDALQDTFAIAFERIHQLRDGEGLRFWLMRIAVRIIRRRLRRRRWFSFFGVQADADAALETLASPEQSPEVRAELLAIDRVLQKLRVEHRIAWTLRFVEGSELEEIAEVCECSLATIKRRIAVADARVKLHLGAEERRP